ncbi:MAG TPA: MogA/MoaB family molybdenum cofactor biosynthesis protein [Acidimicrobiales bacterium]|nr:MogA/MoaB family molybdenum cofactor biosynthesis protein [Acidimicrobiales bacterium]
MRFEAKVLTVSDSVHGGEADDRSGDALSSRLAQAGFEVTARRVVQDGVEPVSEAIRELTEGFAGLVVTTGGTGFSLRDLTPEATSAVLDREAPGLAEAMRLANPLGRLSRAVAGTVGRSLVVNTPGSVSGALECLDAILDVVPHALELLSGSNPHPHLTGSSHGTVGS